MECREDADFDLDDIWEYIAGDSIEAANRWIGKLFDAFEALGQLRAWDTGAKTLPRIRSCSGYLIIYRAERPPLGIAAVTQGSRDIPAFLRRRGRR